MTPITGWLTGHTIKNLLLATLSGVLAGVAMPGLGMAAVAFVTLVPLLWVVLAATAGRAFLYGWLAGTVGFAVSMSWVADTVHLYGGLPYALSYPVMLLLSAYLGAYTGLFALGVQFLIRRGIPLLLVAPLLWVGLEYLRTYLFTGLPWNPLGLALFESTRMIQIADFAGVYGVSWFVVTVNCGIHALSRPLFERHRSFTQAYLLNHGIAVVLIPICVATYGQVQIASLSLFHQQNPNPEGPLHVSLIQPNIPQNSKWDPAFLTTTMARLERLTRQSGGFDPDLVLWPEASAPLVLEHHQPYLDMVSGLSRGLGAHIAVGSLSPVAGAPDKVRNSVYLVTPGGAMHIASKQHLVPFGEYVPLETSLLSFVRKITRGIGDVIPGEKVAVLKFPRGDFGLAVCYEVIFPDQVRHLFAAGATFLATVSNDAWFGASAGPAQHFAHIAFRAVENRSYVVRAANTGISGMADPFGIVHEQTVLNTETATHVRIEPRFTDSFYSRHGDLFARISVILVVLLGAYAMIFREPRERGRKSGGHHASDALN
ncbi:MAG: apolipoprotein N-acyltransferase [Leptospirillia bacterium]